MTQNANHNRQLELANERLAQRVSVAESRLRPRMAEVRNQRDLTLKSLLAMQKSAFAESRAGTGLDPTEYWNQVAEPTAALYRQAAIRVIDSELDAVREAVARFHQSVRYYSKSSGRKPRRPAISGWISDQLVPLTKAAPTSEHINTVGEKWQQKLHRAAVVRSLPELLVQPTSSARNIISITEMRLLSDSPWVNGDRILSAFELATVDIRSHLLDELDRLAGPGSVAKDHTELLVLT